MIAAISIPAAPVPVMDLHSDILLRVLNNGVDIGDDLDWTHTSIPGMQRGGMTDQVFAVWIDSRDLSGFDATARALNLMGTFQQQIRHHSDKIGLATTVAESDALQAEGKIAAWLVMEGGAPIDSDLELLHAFYERGIRGMTLTWMNNLPWAGSSTDREDSEMGLTEFGRDVVREMNALGMVVDLSHVSDQTFYDALEISTDPVMVSHSCCRALSDHPRNVTDDMLRALAENGGVIGINAYTSYLSLEWDAANDAVRERLRDELRQIREELGDGSPAQRLASRKLIEDALAAEGNELPLSVYIDHIVHVIDVAGPEHVGLGSDFDGVGHLPVGLGGCGDWQVVAEALRERGYDEEVVRGIMGGNARRVFAQVTDQ
jgi:membrane dipeptidase